MKKLALACLLFSITVVGANAQVQFGLKTGVNFATLTNSTGGKTFVTPNFGIMLKAPLANGLSLQPEAVYSGQGIKGSDGKIAMNYLNIPVLVTYTLPAGVFFQTGPQLGFLLSAKVKPDGEPDQDFKPFLKSTDFAWAFGTGYLIPNVDLGFNFRYNLGLSNVGKDGGTSKNAVIQIGIFYLFPGGKK